MARRSAVNTTNIPRIANIDRDALYISYGCVRCGERNFENIGKSKISPNVAYNTMSWKCNKCGFVHSKDSDLPFSNWPEEAIQKEFTSAQRFWENFFRLATDKAEYYWKQCNVCGRILPNYEFAKHTGWGELEKQMECKTCKASINALLNPRRTTEQLRESALKRRIAELLAGGDEKLDVKDIFARFDSKCFKTKRVLNINEPDTWELDHTLPSKYFYPLTRINVTLLSTEANQDKSGKWPSEFYSNEELIELSRISGQSLELMASREPIYNTNIDVNSCVDKILTGRTAADLVKRIKELKELLETRNLTHFLSDENKRILGIESS